MRTLRFTPRCSNISNQSGVPGTRMTLSVAPLMVAMSASMIWAGVLGQPPCTTPSCGDNSVKCLSVSSMAPLFLHRV